MNLFEETTPRALESLLAEIHARGMPAGTDSSSLRGTGAQVAADLAAAAEDHGPTP